MTRGQSADSRSRPPSSSRRRWSANARRGARPRGSGESRGDASRRPERSAAAPPPPTSMWVKRCVRRAHTHAHALRAGEHVSRPRRSSRVSLSPAFSSSTRRPSSRRTARAAIPRPRGTTAERRAGRVAGGKKRGVSAAAAASVFPTGYGGPTVGGREWVGGGVWNSADLQSFFPPLGRRAGRGESGAVPPARRRQRV